MKKNTGIFISFILFITLLPLSGYTRPIPDSGQTKCYNDTVEIPCPSPGQDFYGQDGSYLINPPSYTKLDAAGNSLPDSATSWAMVRDNVTGLIWEVKQNKDSVKNYADPHDADNTYTWYDSNPETNGGYAGTPGDGTDTEDFINQLNTANFGGYSDWRLPTQKELTYIANSTDTSYFPNTISSDYWLFATYWSSTTYADETLGAWFGYDYYSYDCYKFCSMHVRAVRGGQVRSSDSLIINNDGTVTDTRTGLMWQQSTGREMTWKESLSFCESLTLSGYSDWRLPSLGELRSLIDYDRYGPAIDTSVFTDTVSSWYWSSTNRSSMNFSHGEVWDTYTLFKPDICYVRAVRGGQIRLSDHLVISSPAQASFWDSGEIMPVTWQTQSISGNVKITLSRDGGKTFETITDSTPNDGSYNWTVSGSYSVNCVLKIEPLNDVTKGTSQGLFVIVSPLTVTTGSVSSVTQTTASSGGNVISDGGSSVSARGVCWNTAQNPTTSNSKTANGTGTGSFTSSITGLSPNTSYYVRAYATNSTGTAYGNQVSFTTSQALSVPTVTTNAVSTITQTTAASGGNIISDGGASVNARGVCWSAAQNPTTANSKTSNGTGTGSFSSSLTGLTANTIYYVRAYATNSKGTGYGSQVSFITQSSYTVSGYVRNSSTAYGISGVTLTFSNSGGTAVTDSSGYYTKTVNSGWSGTVTPSLAGYTFTPANRTYSSVAASYFNQDFSATPITYTISGYIRNAAGTGISDVTVSFSSNAGSVLTDTVGYYSKTVSYGYSGTATPQKSGYTFSPANRPYTSVTANQASQNYIANPTAVPNISLSPQSLIFTKPNAGRLAEKVEEPETQSMESEESAPADGEYATGLVIPDEVKEYWETHTPTTEFRMRRSIPASLDWGVYDSPVKNQSRCNSCWAFAAVALAENMTNRANLSTEDDLSEQVIVSCTYDNYSCQNGGWYGSALNYIQNNGIPPEKCYPYTASDGTCSKQCSSPDFRVKISAFEQLWNTGFNADDLKGALQDGPLCVGMYTPQSFKSYTGGIYRYSPTEPISTQMGHAILLVGYNDSQRYFKAKNSWGTSWGENGYFRISYDDVTSAVKFGKYAVGASGIFVEGKIAQIQEITLSNTGTANLNVTSISSNKAWLSVSPVSFSNILPGEQKKISVSVTDWNAVIAPEDTAIITISSNDPDQPVMTVKVIAMEAMGSAFPSLSVLPPFNSNYSFDNEKFTINVGNSGGETFLDIANYGQGDMLWTASTSDSWLTIKSGSSGTNSGRVLISYLSNTSGSRTGTVTVTSTGAENSPQTVNIYQSNIDEDKDDDGMPDWFEFVYGFDSSNPDDAFGDADEDGLTNLKEYQIGTNPGVADSDGDGMKDGYEVQHGLDPLVYNTNLKDVMIGLQILAGLNTNPAGSNADADKNGKTELKDVLINLRSVAGMK